MNPPSKTAVKITMKLTWKNRVQFFRMAFKVGPYVTFFDADVKEVLIREETLKENNENKLQHNP